MIDASPFFRAAARSAIASCLIAVGLLVSTAGAQAKKPFAEIKQPAGFDAAKRTTAMNMIATGSLAAGDEKTLTDLFQSMFADMTNPTKAQDIHKTRARNIKAQLIRAGNASEQTTHAAANKILLEKLPIIIKNNFHPAVRYNCALLLGELDSVEKKGLNDVPTPLPAALDTLTELLADKKVNDSIRLACLVGMTRHAKAGDAATKAKVAKAALAFLDQLEKSDASARKQEVKFWLEARTMESLGATTTPTPEVVAAMQTRLADEGRPIWERCIAARELGRLKYDANSKIDANALLPDFKKLLDNAVDQGLNRRDLRTVLYSVRRGLNGYEDPTKDSLFLLMTGETQGQATAMKNAIVEMAKVCDNKDLLASRVPLEIEKAADKWRSGGFSETTVDPGESEVLDEDTSGSEETDAPADEEATEEGTDDGGVFP